MRAEKINKYGIGGSTVSDYVDEHPMCIRYSEMDDSADFIVIFAGNNDFTNLYQWENQMILIQKHFMVH